MARHSASNRGAGARTWRISGYAADELVGVGGSGEVWLGHDVRTGDQVALKRMLGGGPALTAEAEALARLDHPHIVRLRAVVEAGDAAVLVMDCVPGPSLAQMLARRGRLRPGEAVAALAPVAAALAHAHSRGVIHGDVTPANIVFTHQGQPMLTDFGSAREIGAVDPASTTPNYTDPMVAAGAPPTPSSDVFAVAAVAFHAVTGVPPWSGATPHDVFGVAVDAELPDLDVLAPEASPELRAVIRRALSSEPSCRCDAEELSLALRQAHPAERVDVAGAGAGSVSHRIAPTHLAPRRRDGTPTAEERLGLLSTSPPDPVRRSGAAGLRRPGAHWGGWAGVGRRLAAFALGAIGLLTAVRLGIAWDSTGTDSGAPSGAPDASTSVSLNVPSPFTSISPSAASRSTSVSVSAPSASTSVLPAMPTGSSAPTGVSRGASPLASEPRVGANRSSVPAGGADHLQPSSATAWSGVLQTLDRARSAAFVAGDPVRLDAVYAPICPALADDVAQIRVLAAAGERVDQVLHEIGPPAVVQADEQRVVLDVVERLGAYHVDTAGHRRSVAAGPPVDYRIELVPVGAGWRIASIAQR
jgi:serine/threonine protein kinase